MKCETCEDDGFLIIDNEHAVPCPDCSERRKFETRCNIAGIGKTWRLAHLPMSLEYKLEGYVGFNQETRNKVKEINLLLSNLRDTLFSYGGLFFHGTTGRGKTYAAYAILMHWLNKGKSVFAIKEEDMFEHAFGGPHEDSDDYDTYWFEHDRLRTCELLLIDEVGATPLDSKGYKKNYFSELIRVRHEQGRVTIMTTNLSPTQIGERFKKRVMSFLKELSVFLEFVSEQDFRDKIHQTKMERLKEFLE